MTFFTVGSVPHIRRVQDKDSVCTRIHGYACRAVLFSFAVWRGGGNKMWKVECMNVIGVSVTACCVAQRGLWCFRASTVMESLKKLDVDAALMYVLFQQNQCCISNLHWRVQSQNLAHWFSDMSCFQWHKQIKKPLYFSGQFCRCTCVLCR